MASTISIFNHRKDHEYYGKLAKKNEGSCYDDYSNMKDVSI